MRENDNKKKLVNSLLLFGSVIVIGVIGYRWIEGWNLFDAIYMTVITLATVGYGETHELTNSGRLFTIFLIVGGLGAVASVLNSFATLLLDNKLNYFLGRKAMNSELKKIKDHAILCGFGQIGLIIALKLQEKKIPFVVIENDLNEIEKMQQMGFVFVQGNATEDASLLNAGIRRAKILVICESDMTINLTLCLAAKELNPNVEVIAQGADRHLEPRIIRAGADSVVYPLALGGEQISEIIVSGYQEDVNKSVELKPAINGYQLQIYQHFNVVPITIKDAVEKVNGLRAIAYKPKQSDLVDNPNVDIQLFEDDYIVVLINPDLRHVNSSDEKKGKPHIIEWSDELSMGVPSIDEEHLRLVHLINRFNEALFNGDSQKNIVTTFDRLIEYSLEHFKNEEELMRLHGYPELEEHMLEHQKLMHTVMALNKDKCYVFPMSVSEFLDSWLINHILICDKKYKDFV